MEERESKIEDGGTNTGAVRLFVAIVLPDEVKDKIEKTQGEMRRALSSGGVRWTRREQFHLTLKFLGNVEISRVAELTESLRNACLDFTALRLRAGRIGFFPDMRRPRVVWAGVRDEKDILPRLQLAIETATENFTKERPEGKFAGHVTLGRIQRIQRQQAEILTRLALSMEERFFGDWVAGQVELIRSELSSSGSHYTTIAAIPLASRK